MHKSQELTLTDERFRLDYREHPADARKFHPRTSLRGIPVSYRAQHVTNYAQFGACVDHILLSYDRQDFGASQRPSV